MQRPAPAGFIRALRSAEIHQGILRGVGLLHPVGIEDHALPLIDVGLLPADVYKRQALACYWLFLLSWIPITIHCMFQKTTVWEEIRHTRNLTAVPGCGKAPAL